MPPGSFPPQLGGCTEPSYLMGTSAPNAQGFTSAAYNRLQWWDKTAPSTGPITKHFECEFTPGLATVVGSAMTAVEQNGHRVVSWDRPGTGLQNLGQLKARNSRCGAIDRKAILYFVREYSAAECPCSTW